MPGVEMWMAYWLLDVSIKAALLALAAWAGMSVFRVRSTSVRHRVWFLVLVGMLLLPALVNLAPSVSLPGWLYPTLQVAAVADEAPVETGVGIEPQPIAAEARPAVAPVEWPPMSEAHDAASPAVVQSEPLETFPVANVTLEVEPRTRKTPELPPAGRNGFALAVICVYLAGVALLTVRLLVGATQAWGLVRRARLVDLPISVTRARVAESDEVRVPLTIGFWRPVIVLPVDWTTWSDSFLAMVLAHEGEHVRRGDTQVTLLAALNCVVYWFHPTAWVVRRRLTCLAEHACDDEVIRAMGNRDDYAQNLLEMAGRVTHGSGRLRPLGVTMTRKANVEKRIEAIIDADRPLSRKIGAVGALLLACVVAPLVLLAAGLRPTDSTLAAQAEPTVDEIADVDNGKPNATDSQENGETLPIGTKYPASKRVSNPDNGHQYQRIDVSMSWHKAGELCNRLGGHLATVTSEEESNFIYEHFAEEHICWLGASDEKEEGTWKWATEEPFEFTYWGVNEPNNSAQAEHYLVLGNTQPVYVEGRRYSYRCGPNWNDNVADGRYRGFPVAFPVCEWDSPPTEDASHLLVMPEEGSLHELLGFIEDLKEFRPNRSLEGADYSWQAPQAMEDAAKRIFELKEDDWSKAAQTAFHVLLEEQIGAILRSSPQQQRLTLQFVQEFLKAKLERKLEPQDAELALWAARVFERATGGGEMAKEAYQSFAEPIGNSDSKELSDVVRLMEGAVRRLELEGKPMQITGATLDGAEFDWDAYRGKVVLVHFWDSQSETSQTALKNIKWNYDLFHDRGFDVVGISLDRDPDALKDFVAKEQIPWATLHDAESKTGHPVAAHYGVMDAPKSFLLDQQGNVVLLDGQDQQISQALSQSLGSPYSEKFLAPPYSPQGQLTCLDLQPKATRGLEDKAFANWEGNDLAELPRGEQTFGGVKFHIADALVQLRGQFMLDVPRAVEGIPIGGALTRLYVLHGVLWGISGGDVEDGTVIGRYCVRFEDGTSAIVPIVYGQSVRDWWDVDGSKAVTNAELAWAGENVRSRAAGSRLRLYLAAWQNPHPQKKVVSLDFVSAQTTAAPFCVAMTLEAATGP